jgi:phage tail protein X
MASATGIIYTAIQGDTWDNIAWRFYGDATQIGPLLQANCGIRVPFESALDAGVQIVVPIIEQSDVNTADLPPWRQS